MLVISLLKIQQPSVVVLKLKSIVMKVIRVRSILVTHSLAVFPWMLVFRIWPINVRLWDVIKMDVPIRRSYVLLLSVRPQCVPTTGECDYTPVSCDDGDACTTDSCDTTTGGCLNVPIVCDDEDVCTTDSCDPITGSCQFSSPKSCDDNNSCTLDVCDPIRDCLHTPDDLVCASGDPCLIGFCDLTLGCQTKPAVCPAQQTDIYCLLTICVPYEGCANESRACNASSLVCEISSCNEDTDKCESTPLICGLGVDTGVIVGSVVVSAAVIGGVIAGAVLAVAGLGGGGAVAYFQLAAAGEDSNTANNPLYNDPNQAAVNPLYHV
jgi:hypothetical protein